MFSKYLNIWEHNIDNVANNNNNNQTGMARISNSVSGGQRHVIHLTIIRRFSCPSLAYMCTKVTKKPI